VRPRLGVAFNLVFEGEDAVAHGGVFGGGMLAGEEAVVGVEGGVEQVLAVEFLEDTRLEQKRGRWGRRDGRPHFFEIGDAGWVIEIVESDW
jgi:hypothetical protein